MIVGNIWRKPVSTQASIFRGIAGVGEFGELLILFPMAQTDKNRPRNARVIVENKVAPFPGTVYKYTIMQISVLFAGLNLVL